MSTLNLKKNVQIVHWSKDLLCAQIPNSELGMLIHEQSQIAIETTYSYQARLYISSQLTEALLCFVLHFGKHWDELERYETNLRGYFQRQGFSCIEGEPHRGQLSIKNCNITLTNCYPDCTHDAYCIQEMNQLERFKLEICQSFGVTRISLRDIKRQRVPV